jgi:methylenetetrahydrofolate dehydrogenase (NADP+) / methenyltetrahydrofolate cyclohydrolase
MPATLIDGKAQAAALRTMLTRIVKKLNRRPRLATILVGDDPASQVYVTNKIKACGEVGIAAQPERLPASASADRILSLISQLNKDPLVHGILVQMPLPEKLDTNHILAAIDPAKDVDGLHPYNAGLLAQNSPGGFVPCTPRGCLQLIKSVMPSLFGRPALVIGRSRLVGMPMAHLLVQQNCTVTIAHSKSRDVPQLAAASEVIVAAAGSPGLVRRDWVKPGAVVIDVGITRAGDKLLGDVAAEVHEVNCYLTPVPGGVGPMTVANLLANTIIAACRQHGEPVPPELLT